MSFFSSKKKSAPARFQSNPTSGKSKSGGKKRPIIQFDPSKFIQNKEELIAPEVYTASNSFADFGLLPQLQENIAQKGYAVPTAIQDKALAPILNGHDLVGTANTGTGKTAAFLIPLVHRIASGKLSKVLIIAPTRELAQQIDEELFILKNKFGLQSAVCIGGLRLDRQIAQLAKNPAFIIGTPGRLKDLEKNRALSFADCNGLVLDEVDTMLNMGFINDITYILRKMPAKRQSLFFSATISPSIQKIIDQFLKSPVSISVKTRQSSAHIKQEVVSIGTSNKLDLLHDLLLKPEMKKVIIFARTKRATDALARSLKERGFTIASIHGDKTQAQRKKALDVFKAGTISILLATDVVSRGIDIDDISHVINFDLPPTQDDYIHRIGRTGRAGSNGTAITLVA
jgi:superfamily II DNA/RNA helicase